MLLQPEGRKWRWKHTSKDSSSRRALSTLIRCRVNVQRSLVKMYFSLAQLTLCFSSLVLLVVWSSALKICVSDMSVELIL